MTILRKMVLLLLVSSFLGFPMAMAMDKDREGKHFKIFEQLNLTEEQSQQLKATKKDQWSERKASKEKMEGLQEKLNAELMKPQLDKAAIYAIHEELKAFHIEMADRRIESMIAIRGILTQEQFAKFLSLTKELRHKKFKE